MFKFFNKNNFLDDLWGNFQIILDDISNPNSRINLLDKSGILISNHANNDFTKKYSIIYLIRFIKSLIRASRLF